ncbi:DUF4476 domain-containing protein [Chitinophaga rhizosphaerae]|uniref:DUF4476 domain-containing protein n=1 Tax=Chitinophaga rhizosphaerae TaxID=1864947 RepID=UPI000F7FBF0C|nr:DUF4476 domain-containing protein [Chitinophaga rhizosphaerae]
MQSIKLKLLYLACCLFIATGLAAQDASYFVYIQHEKQQPFYVKLDGKLLSSSVKGYVILPKMEAGKVPVTIGFPKGEAPEQQFTIRLAGNRDYGYLLKNNGDQEWALYDLQTFASLKSAGAGGAQPAEKPAESEAVAVTRISSDSATPEQKELINNVQADVEAALAKKKAEEKAAGEQSAEETPAPSAEMPADTTPVVAQTAPKKKNSFAESLDKVVTDDRPAEMDFPKPRPAAATEAPVDVPAPAAEPEKPAKKRKKGQRDPLTEEEKELLGSVMEEEKRAAADEALKEAEAAAAGDAAKEAPKDAPMEQPVAEKAPEEKPRKAKKKKGGSEPEFIDFGEAPAAMPAATPAATVPEPRSVPAEEEGASAKDAREARRQQKKAAREAADREALARDSLANIGWHDAAPETKEKKSDLKMVNSDCPKVLETEAFRKLLRTMNSRRTDADMVDAFRKGTRNTCVSTEQVRALAQLISSDENRYQLMDAAYARTYDSDNFSKLSDLLTDNYYKNRFKAMLKR